MQDSVLQLHPKRGRQFSCLLARSRSGGKGQRFFAHGFTLIELLTVVAIIGILALLIVVGVGKARDRAMATSSASNLRQWGSALHLYLTDSPSKGILPGEGVRDQPNWTHVGHPDDSEAWFNVLPPYVGEKPLSEFTRADQERMWSGKTIHSDPAAELNERVIGRRPPFSYMMNSQLPDGGRVRLVEVNRPDRVVFMTETRTSPNDRLPGATTSADLARSKGRNNRVSARHSGNVHIAFIDGSVRSFEAAYVYNNNRDPKSTGGDNLPNIRWTLAE